MLLLLFSKCHSQRVEDWVGRRCFTVWVYLRNHFWRKKKKWGNSEESVYLITRTNRFYMLRFVCLFFFHLVRGGISVGLWTLTLLQIHELISQSFVFFLFFTNHSTWERERVHVSWSVWAFIGITQSHKHPQSMHQNGLKFRPMQGPYTESSFEMYIQCEGLKWFFFFFLVKFYILSLL